MFPDAGFTLAWQHLDAARNIEASTAIMRGDAEPMRKMLDTLDTLDALDAGGT
jgi:hypothetical protein